MNEAGYKILSASDGSPQPDAEQRFWRRQFLATRTRPQITFDVIVGIILPVLCLIFDPIVFRGGFRGEGGILKNFQLFAYTVIALEVLTLAVWLVWGERAGTWSSAIGGILLAGALFSFVIAVAILPLSLLGLMFAFIGALGFTPFVTAFIYLRNGRRALRVANAGARGWEFVGALLLGMVFVLGGPALAQWKVSEMAAQSVRELTGGDRKLAAKAVQRLRYINLITDLDLDELVRAYGRSSDPAYKVRLARVYFEITGQSIEKRQQIMSD
jgi:hypothetical protein